MIFPNPIVKLVNKAMEQDGPLDWLKLRGWKKLRREALVSPCGGWVFKEAYITSPHWDKLDRKLRIPECAVPTLYIGAEGYYPYLLQPKADTSAASIDLAMSTLEARPNIEFYDFHDGNVAMYKGRAVLIDW